MLSTAGSPALNFAEQVRRHLAQLHLPQKYSMLYKAFSAMLGVLIL